MKKLKLHTPDLTAANIDRIAALFPNCVTEAADEQGKLKHAIDFDLLRQELSPDLVEGPQERYRLDWPGKREALALANTPVALTLRPCREESVDFENTKNLYIEGDNLDALKLLQETYLGQVKMIYIDPPYNTGNDFIYDDNFSMSREDYEALSGKRDEEGRALFDEEKWRQNSSSSGRFHSEWLSMMYPRLKLARNLLREDGVIVISIDDGEAANLGRMCDEIFGKGNFVGNIAWESKTKSQNTKEAFNKLQPKVEHLIVYTKRTGRRFNLIQTGSKDYGLSDKLGAFRWHAVEQMSASGIRGRETMDYPILGVVPLEGNQWKLGRETVQASINRNEAKIENGRPYIKMRPNDERSEITEPFWGFLSKEMGTAESAKKELNAILGEVGFETVKPVEVIKKLSFHAAASNSIILDFFSGSATTAHAVMQLNAEDGGNRRHIMVQLPEPCDEKSEAFKAGYKTIAEIGKERIRRAGKKILQEWQAKHGATPDQLKLNTENPDASPPDIGFRVLKIDSSNFRDIARTPDELEQQELALHTDHLKPDRTTEDLLFQVLVDWGVDLALPIVAETLHGKRVFFVDQNALAACFDTGLTDELVRTIAGRKPLRVVFRDDGFGDDSTRINVEQIFKLLSPGTEVKAL